MTKQKANRINKNGNIFLLKDKKMIERFVIQEQIDSRLYDYICFKFKDDIFELLDESYDQFYSIIG